MSLHEIQPDVQKTLLDIKECCVSVTPKVFQYYYDKVKTKKKRKRSRGSGKSVWMLLDELKEIIFWFVSSRYAITIVKMIERMMFSEMAELLVQKFTSHSYAQFIRGQSLPYKIIVFLANNTFYTITIVPSLLTFSYFYLFTYYYFIIH